MYNHRLELMVAKNTTTEEDGKETKRKLDLVGKINFLDSDQKVKDSLECKMSLTGDEGTVAAYLDGFTWIGTNLGGTLYEVNTTLDHFSQENKSKEIETGIQSSLEVEEPKDKTVVVTFREIADTDEKAKEKILAEMQIRDGHGQSTVSPGDLLDELAIDEEDRVYIEEMIAHLTEENKLVFDGSNLSLPEDDDVDTTGLEAADPDDEEDPEALEEPSDPVEEEPTSSILDATIREKIISYIKSHDQGRGCRSETIVKHVCWRMHSEEAARDLIKKMVEENQITLHPDTDYLTLFPYTPVSMDPLKSNRCKEFQSKDGVKVRSGTIGHSCTNCEMFLEDGTCDEGIALKRSAEPEGGIPDPDAEEKNATRERVKSAMRKAVEKSEAQRTIESHPEPGTMDYQAQIDQARSMLSIDTAPGVKFPIMLDACVQARGGQGVPIVEISRRFKNLIKDDEDLPRWLALRQGKGVVTETNGQIMLFRLELPLFTDPRLMEQQKKTKKKRVTKEG